MYTYNPFTRKPDYYQTGGGGGAVSSVNTLTGAVVLTTDNINEGSTNKYFTNARVDTEFDTRLATKSTTNLSEGTNLYYTDARVRLNRLDQMAKPTSFVDMNNQTVANVNTPLASTDGTNKGYVDAAVQGYNPKAVRAASTGSNITLSGTQTIDGIALVAGDNVLIKDQTTASQNGLYTVASGAWSRSSFASSTAQLNGLYALVDEGTLNQGTGWLLITDPDTPIVVGTTSLTFSQFTGMGDITVSSPIIKTGNQLSIQVANTSQNGYLSTTDWNTFNGKQSAIGYTSANKAGDTFTGDVSISSTGALQIPVGTTVQQPTGANGKIRYNTNTGRYEFYVGSAWVNHVRLNGDTMTGTLTLVTGGATVSPLTFVPGTTLTTPATGAFEFDGTYLYITDNAGTPARHTLSTLDQAVILTNKTLTTPTIGNFSNATHNHTNATGGGQLTDAALSSAVGVAKGGTGAVTLTGVLIGNGTSAFTTKTNPTGAFIGDTDTQTLTNKTLTTPKIAQINDTNGNPYIVSTATASAVNAILITNGATGTGPIISVGGSGADTNVDVVIKGIGTGKVRTDSHYGAFTVDTWASTMTLDLGPSGGNRHQITLAAATTSISGFLNTTSGMFVFLELVQDGTGTRTISQWPHNATTFVPSAVNTSTNVITVVPNIPTTTPITFTSTGALPTGLSAGTTYYAINQSSTTIKVATTIANAQAGTAVSLTTQGSATHSIYTETRWATSNSQPSLTAGAYRRDWIGFLISDAANGIYEGAVIHQDI